MDILVPLDYNKDSSLEQGLTLIVVSNFSLNRACENISVDEKVESTKH